MLRGTEDPNRVYVIGEMEASEVDGVKEFFGSDKMQTAFEQVNDMSTAPLEFVWLDDVTPG